MVEVFDDLREHMSTMPETGIPEAVDIKPETYMLTMRIGICFAEDTCKIIAEMLRDGFPDPKYLLDIAGQCLRFYEWLAPVYEILLEQHGEHQRDHVIGFSDLLRSMLEESKESGEG